MANTWAIRQRLREGSDEVQAFELQNAERASDDKAFGQYLDIANESAGPGFGALATCLLRAKCCPSVGLKTSKSQVAIHHVEDARYLPQALRKENGGEGGSQQQQRTERRGRWSEEMVWWVNFRLAEQEQQIRIHHAHQTGHIFRITARSCHRDTIDPAELAVL
ncbi:uncharacterized protein UBRO_20252 [Ustilago bromivora]|uniref:Uncharacterized protein n=1 Tax=Ustilago bromivora TaxID=307758 RepID=A0A1K0FYY5_9BASI|nr:uncharacterized protein UBRO_20252 [Ustilago bromivora]